MVNCKETKEKLTKVLGMRVGETLYDKFLTVKNEKRLRRNSDLLFLIVEDWLANYGGEERPPPALKLRGSVKKSATS